MSIASISYDSLSNAADEAKDVAKKLDTYANSLNSSVYKKLNNYKGPWTSNISNAHSKLDDKITRLHNKATDYRDYSDSLASLGAQCLSVDKNVATRIATLTASFKTAHGIETNTFLETIQYGRRIMLNSTVVGRWLSGGIDDPLRLYSNTTTDIHKTLWNYYGVRQFVQGSLQAQVEIDTAGVPVALAIISLCYGKGDFFSIVDLIDGTIEGFLGGTVNLIFEYIGLVNYFTGDPANGRQWSSIDNAQQALRRKTDFKVCHIVASAIDGVHIVCNILDIVDGLETGLTALRKGSKWIFSGEMPGTTIIKNLKKYYFDFKACPSGATKIEKLETISDTLRSIKHLTDVREDLYHDVVAIMDTAKNDASKLWETILDTSSNNVMDHIFLPGVNLVEFKNSDGDDQVISFKDINDWIFDVVDVFSSVKTATDCIDNIDRTKLSNDFTAFTEGILNLNTVFYDELMMFLGERTLSSVMLDKMAEPVDINISIPEIHVPKVNLVFSFDQ